MNAGLAFKAAAVGAFAGLPAAAAAAARVRVALGLSFAALADAAVVVATIAAALAGDAGFGAAGARPLLGLSGEVG